ncbi:MAG TPA: hypothetical protein VEZ42_03935, partial [Pseudonocardia sp.]|nr:hypothetical protein [Pseudonocardia sp.]
MGELGEQRDEPAGTGSGRSDGSPAPARRSRVARRAPRPSTRRVHAASTPVSTRSAAVDAEPGPAAGAGHDSDQGSVQPGPLAPATAAR